MSDPLQAVLGIKLIHLAAGFFGGLVRAIVHPKNSLMFTIGTTIVGALFAAYLTPLVLPFVLSWSGVRDQSIEGATGFVLGLCGLAFAEGIVKMARRWRDNPTLPKCKD
ncbi:hypothetical protein [Pseudovibrio sp. Ad37]|uniref:hypothetical protein n=1 Tax=Pseudovibrio sp. Ad37 TaxID=989422 RepID=UPI0007AE42B6|nr:hypothetical protein [Pseudovibrio sp. Ad37]KZL22723.1 hypothetical protein PsAD37_03282 [Pseudovibrio sp. Ad37]